MSDRHSARRLTIVLTWLVVVSACVLIIVSRLNVSFDLGVLLPSAKEDAEKVLVERIGQSPGSRFMFVALPASIQSAIPQIINSLEQSARISRVLTDEPATDVSGIPETLRRNRYLLDERPIDQTLLDEQFRERKEEARFLAGNSFIEFVKQDPTMAMARIFDNVQGLSSSKGEWVTEAGEKVLIVETEAAAFDLVGQREAMQELRSVMQVSIGNSAKDVRLSGIGVIGVELEAQIRREAEWRTMSASIMLVLVLLIAYRRFGVVLLSALPLLTGAVMALAAVSTLFGAVHGITLAFGFTLLGIGIDYPVHLMSHARRRSAAEAIGKIWSTLRLGVVSTLIAYAALATSGSEGIRQLGVFTATGLIGIACVTRFVLPILFRESANASVPVDYQAGYSTRKLKWWPPLLALVLAVVVSFTAVSTPIFEDDLSALSPVPPQLLKTEQELRQAVGSPDPRYVMTIRESGLQEVLEATERLDAALSEDSPEFLAGWFPVTRLIPSADIQRARLARLPDDTELREIVGKAAGANGFAPMVFDSFIRSVNDARKQPLIEATTYAGSELESLVRMHLYESDDQWVSVVAAYGLKDPDALMKWLKASTLSVELVDLKKTSETLVARYRQSLGLVLIIAALAIFLMLVWRTTLQRGAWLLFTTISTIIFTALVVRIISGPLDLYHLMALLLVAGLVLDYALFLSRDDPKDNSAHDTAHAVVTCTVSTAATFAILAFSSIPALRSLGMAVSIGTIVGFIFAYSSTGWITRRPWQ